MTAPRETPDGRYIIVRGRLWRRSDPRLTEDMRQRLVDELMAARRAVRAAGDAPAMADARARVHAAKTALGERGPTWWDDGAPDENRKLVRNSSYADWYAGVPDD